MANVIPPPEHGVSERIGAMDELADTLKSLQPSRRVADLRHLAGYADELLCALGTIEESTWAVEDLWDLSSALDRLAEHRDTLDRLATLDDLADDVQALARDIRAVRHHSDELEWALEELKADEEVCP